MIITIHQPDLMPWLGFFNKICTADTWVVLDHTLNNPRDSSFWGRRVKILINGEGKWLSLPLVKEKGKLGVPINQMEFDLHSDKPFVKALASVQNSYRKAPYFQDVFPLVESYITAGQSSLLHRNLDFIRKVLLKLNIDTKIVLSSSMDCELSSTDLLVEIVEKLGGTAYLAGDGAGGYQDDSLFKQNGIDLMFNKFQHPTYKQFRSENFVSGLSIIDSLMFNGFEGTEGLLKENK